MLNVDLNALNNNRKSPLGESIFQFIENQIELIDLPLEIKEVEAEHQKIVQSHASKSLSVKEAEEISALSDELNELKQRLRTAETKQTVLKSELAAHLKKVEPQKISYQYSGETYEVWYNPTKGVNCLKL